MCQSSPCVASFVQLFLGSLNLQGQSASWHRTPSLGVLPNGGALVIFCALICTPRVVLVQWFLLWLPFLRLSGLFRSLHISPQSEPSFDSALEDSTHIADGIDPESLELLYESSFGARISVCRLSASRRSPSQDSEFYSFWTRDVLFGEWNSWALSLPIWVTRVSSSAEVRWLKCSRATRMMGRLVAQHYHSKWTMHCSPFVSLSRAHNNTLVIICCRDQVPSKQPSCIRSF